MKNIPLRTLFAVLSMVGAYLCFGFITVVPKAFVDFPCFAGYDNENQCVVVESPAADEVTEERIEAYFSTAQVGLGGGGCHIQESHTDSLEMDTPVLRLKFERSGERLLVNGNELEAGEKFSFTKFWNLNPWTIYSINFTNYGVVPICETTAPARIVIVGEYENRVSLVKAAVVLFILLAAVLGLSRRSRQDSADHS